MVTKLRIFSRGLPVLIVLLLWVPENVLLSAPNSTMHSYGLVTPSPPSSNICKYPGNFSDPCSYVLQNCKDLRGVLFDPLAFYYCDLRKNMGTSKSQNGEAKDTWIPKLVYSLIMLPLVIVFFLIMYFSANDHLAPTLCIISRWLKLSPTVAGVTLLALGNGAPDLFTSLAGTDDMESVPLIIGGAVGSGAFILLLVFGAVILTVTKPVFNRRDTEGDMEPKPDYEKANHPSTLERVTTTPKRSSMGSPVSSHDLLSAHGLEVKGLAFRSFEILDSGIITRDSTGPPSETDVRDAESNTSPPSLDHSKTQSKRTITSLSRFSFSKHIILYLYSIVQLMVMSEQHYITYFFPIFGISLYICNLGVVILLEILRRNRRPRTKKSEGSEITRNLERNDISSDAKKTKKSIMPQKLLLATVTRACLEDWLYQWRQEKRIYRKILLILLTPISLLVTISIPPLYMEQGSQDTYGTPRSPYERTKDHAGTSVGSINDQLVNDTSCVPFAYDRIRLVIFPFFSFAILFHFLELWEIEVGVIYGWALYLIIASSLSLIFIITTTNDKSPIFRPFIVMAAFIMSIFWIYGVSDQIVTVLQSFALVIPALSTSFMGMTILAWGNSFGDLVVDVAIAKSCIAIPEPFNNINYQETSVVWTSRARAGFETAVTGILCGPVQNVLLSMGISFLKILLHDKIPLYGKSSYISCDPVLRFGFIFLLGSIVLIAVLICFVWKFRHIPRWFGYYLVGSYLLLFLPIVTLGGIGVIPGWNIPSSSGTT